MGSLAFSMRSLRPIAASNTSSFDLETSIPMKPGDIVMRPVPVVRGPLRTASCNCSGGSKRGGDHALRGLHDQGPNGLPPHSTLTHPAHTGTQVVPRTQQSVFRGGSYQLSRRVRVRLQRLGPLPLAPSLTRCRS